MKSYYLLFVLLVTFTSLAAQTQTPEDKVRNLITANGGRANFEMVMVQMIDLQSEAMQDLLPAEFFEEFKKDVLESGYDEILELIVPIYLKHYTEDEIDQMTTFFQSDLGQVMVEKTPMIMQESMAAGQQWGGAMGGMIAERLQNVDQLLYEFELTEDLSRFQKGNFKDVSPDGAEITFSRYNDKQCERVGGNEKCYRIEWLSNNRYRLQRMDAKGELTGEDPIDVNIYEADQIGYRYIVQLPGGEYLKGEIQSNNKKL